MNQCQHVAAGPSHSSGVTHEFRSAYYLAGQLLLLLRQLAQMDTKAREEPQQDVDKLLRKSADELASGRNELTRLQEENQQTIDRFDLASMVTLLGTLLYSYYSCPDGGEWVQHVADACAQLAKLAAVCQAGRQGFLQHGQSSIEAKQGELREKRIQTKYKWEDKLGASANNTASLRGLENISKLMHRQDAIIQSYQTGFATGRGA